MPLDQSQLKRWFVEGFAKILRARAREDAMAARPRLVVNFGFLPAGVQPTRDALSSARVECEQVGESVDGHICLDCPRLVFWMVAPERDRLKMFCRRDPGTKR